MCRGAESLRGKKGRNREGFREQRALERDEEIFLEVIPWSLGCDGEEFWCQGWEQTGFVGEFERKTREKLKENKGKKRSILSAWWFVTQVRTYFHSGNCPSIF